MKKEKGISVKFETMYINVHAICGVNNVYIVKTRDAKVSLDRKGGKKEEEREREIVGRFWDLLLSDITPYKE